MFCGRGKKKYDNIFEPKLFWESQKGFPLLLNFITKASSHISWKYLNHLFSHLFNESSNNQETKYLKIKKAPSLKFLTKHFTPSLLNLPTKTESKTKNPFLPLLKLCFLQLIKSALKFYTRQVSASNKNIQIKLHKIFVRFFMLKSIRENPTDIFQKALFIPQI